MNCSRLSARATLFALLQLVFVSSMALADEWTGFMGNQRDGVLREENVIEEIGEQGLAVLWRTKIAGGYAGPSVAGGRVFVFDYVKKSGNAFNSPNERANIDGQERLIALDVATGDELWNHSYDCPYSISYPAGPRCTPTIDGDRVYILGSEGDFRCLNVADGTLIWKRSLKADFGAAVPIWGFSSHPLVDGDLVYTMVGGDGQGIIAFDKMTGEVRWQALDAPAGYCPPSIIQFGGVRQLISYSPTGIDSLHPETGESYWHIDLTPMYEMSINRPVISGNRMYASGIRTESAMILLDETRPGAEVLWRGEPKSSLYTSNSTPLFVDGVVYGTDCNEGSLIAMDAETGERLWSTFDATRPGTERFLKHGTAFLTRIKDSDRYLLFNEVGSLIVATLTRAGYTERGSFQLLEPTGEAFGRDVVWSHPAYSNGVAYARNDEEIVAVKIAK